MGRSRSRRRRSRRRTRRKSRLSDWWGRWISVNPDTILDEMNRSIEKPIDSVRAPGTDYYDIPLKYALLEYDKKYKAFTISFWPSKDVRNEWIWSNGLNKKGIKYEKWTVKKPYKYTKNRGWKIQQHHYNYAIPE